MKNQENPPNDETRRSSRQETPTTASARPKSGRPPAAEAAPSLSKEKSGVAELLNALLADEFVLYVKTLNYHWNIRGMQFHSLHPFLEKIYQDQFSVVDDLAERVRTVGGTALGSMEDFVKFAHVREQQGFPPDPRAMFDNLVQDYDSILMSLRSAIDKMEEPFNDPGTCNLLESLLERQEKTAWMLRTHLDKDLG